MPGDDLIFYGTTGPAGTSDANPSTPDPNDWLGKFRAPETLHEFQSTLTANQNVRSRHYVVDSSRIGDGEDAHVFKWVLIQTGPNSLAAGRVMSFEDATGTFKLDRLLGPTVAAIGDSYAVFDVNNVWPDVTAAQAADGDTRYRCICFRNQHGTAISNVRVHFTDLNAQGNALMRMHQKTTGWPFIQRSDDETDLYDSLGLRDPLGGSDGFAQCGPWIIPYAYVFATPQMTTLLNNFHLAIWLKRTIPENHRYRRSIAALIVCESTTTGSDPDPLVGAAVMAWDVEGEDPEATIVQDRYTYIGGGVRLTADVTAAGVLLEDRPVQWVIRSGDLGSIFTDDDPLAGWDTTDEDGETQATLIAPELQSAAGLVTHPRLIIGAGEEVGDPRPRVSGVLAATFSYTVSATGSLPATSRSYLSATDGFMVGH